MDDYSTGRHRTKRKLISKNGRPKDNHTGADNQAFRMADLYTISPPNFTEDVGNIFETGHGDEDQHFASMLFKHNSTNDYKDGKYATTRHLPINGYTHRSVTANGGLKPLKTSSLSSATVRSAYPFGTMARTYFVSLEDSLKHKQASDKKSCVSFFDIETDKVSSYLYRPGENITGTVTIMIRKHLEIRFIDMTVTGQGQLTMKKSDFPQTVRETYLHKEKSIIGAHDSSLSSVLTPGRYTSKFCIKLPTELPSTLHNEDVDNGTSFDVTYTIKVRMCDDVGVPSTPAASAHSKRVRVFLEKQMNFNVQRGFDLSTVPDSTSPIVHTEQVYLACTHRQPAIVSLNLDRAVFLAGDDIRLQLQISLPRSQSVKEIACKLQEFVTSSPKQEPKVITLSKIITKNPSLSEEKLPSHARGDNTFNLTMPTHTKLISPFSLGKSKIKFAYGLLVEIKFSPAGGILAFQVPVGIGPCADPIYAEKMASKKLVPLFNRAKRFPCFTSETVHAETNPRSLVARKAASVQVTTKYSNGLFTRCFLCCTSAGD